MQGIEAAAVAARLLLLSTEDERAAQPWQGEDGWQASFVRSLQEYSDRYRITAVELSKLPKLGPVLPGERCGAVSMRLLR